MSMMVSALLVFLHHLSESIPAILVTAAFAVLVLCAASCMCAPCRADDRLFNRHVF